MDALNAKLADLEKNYEDIQYKKRDLELEELSLETQRRWLEEERLKLSYVLSNHEEDQVKRDLTAIGELLELSAVILGTLRILAEEPTDKEKLYSIDIKCRTVIDSGLTGLRVAVVVKTRSPRVEAIVRELFVQEGPVCNDTLSKLSWERNWDNGTRIRLTTHEALS